MTTDDPSFVAKNPNVLAGLTPHGAVWAFSNIAESIWHPLTWLSLMLDATVGGPGPRVFHLMNLALHIANTSLLFHVLTRMTGRASRSAFVAALFAVHPLHVESVAWVTERKDVLSTLFWMLTLLTYWRYVEKPGGMRYLAIVVSFALGLMAKPMLVTLPFVLLLLDYWPLGRSEAGGPSTGIRWPTPRPPLGGAVVAPERSQHDSERVRGAPRGLLGRRPARPWLDLRAALVEKGPLLVLSAASSATALWAEERGGSMSTLVPLPFSVRAANAAVSCMTYVQKMIWPTGLAFPYPYSLERLSPLRVAVSCATVIGVSALALSMRRLRPPLAVGWFWYLITLLPVIGLLQVGDQAMADRYTYVPLIGLFIVIAWGVPDLLDAATGRLARHVPLLGRAAWRRYSMAAVAVVTILALATAAHRQAGHWRNTMALATHALEVTQHNAAAHQSVAVQLSETGRVEEALVHFREALRISPYLADAHANIGATLTHLGRVDEAITHYREFLRLRPGDPDGEAHLGALLIEGGQLDEAVSLLRESIRVGGDTHFAHKQLGSALARQGMDAEAIVHLREALRGEPDDPEVAAGLGTALMRRGELEEAESVLASALHFAPDNKAAHKNLGVVLAKRGKIREAIAQFSETLRLDPGDEGARLNLERARALLRDAGR